MKTDENDDMKFTPIIGRLDGKGFAINSRDLYLAA